MIVVQLLMRKVKGFILENDHIPDSTEIQFPFPGMYNMPLKHNLLNLEMVERRKDVEARLEIIADCRRRQETQGMRLEEFNNEIDEINAKSAEIKEKITSLEEKSAALRKSAADAKATISEHVNRRSAKESES